MQVFVHMSCLHIMVDHHVTNLSFVNSIYHNIMTEIFYTIRIFVLSYLWGHKLFVSRQ